MSQWHSLSVPKGIIGKGCLWEEERGVERWILARSFTYWDFEILRCHQSKASAWPLCSNPPTHARGPRGAPKGVQSTDRPLEESHGGWQGLRLCASFLWAIGWGSTKNSVTSACKAGQWGLSCRGSEQCIPSHIHAQRTLHLSHQPRSYHPVLHPAQAACGSLEWPSSLLGPSGLTSPPGQIPLAPQYSIFYCPSLEVQGPLVLEAFPSCLNPRPLTLP